MIRQTVIKLETIKHSLRNFARTVLFGMSSSNRSDGDPGLQRGELLRVRSALVALTLLVFGGISIASNATNVQAATSNTLNFQARLLNSSGSLVPDGYYNIEFKLYDAATSGSLLWTETYYDSNGATAGNDNRVRVKNGYFSVNLGSLTAFGSSINWDQQLWLTMNIGGSSQTASPTWDGEMDPRIKLTGVPYAFSAGSLVQVQGSYRGTLDFDTLTGNQAVLLPDESGTLCIQNSSACGFATGSGAAFLQGGNDFDTDAILGTTDNDDLNIITNDTNRITVRADGHVFINNTNLTVDATNHRVGIGVAEPDYKLHIEYGDDFIDGVQLGIINNSPTGNSNASLLLGGNGLTVQGFIEADGLGTVYGDPGLNVGTATNHKLGLVTNDEVRLEVQADGDLAVDTDTLFVDATNNRIGIGTASPQYSLDISASNATELGQAISIFNSSTSDHSNASILMSANNGAITGYLGLDGLGSVSGAAGLYLATTTADPITIVTDSQPRIIVAGDGDVSIDTDTLYVNAANDAVFIGPVHPIFGLLPLGLQVNKTFSGSTSCAVGCYGVQSIVTIDDPTTPNLGTGFTTQVVTADSSFTLTSALGVLIHTPNKGAASTITNGVGLQVNMQTAGTNNAGIIIDEATGTKQVNLLVGTLTIPSGEYSIYNSSTDQNYFAGSLGIGDSSPDATLDVAGTFQFDGNGVFGDASSDTLTINGTAVSIPNNLNFDSGTLYVDSANNRVGIGRSDPEYLLDVNGDGAVAGSFYVRRSASCCTTDVLALSSGDSSSTIATGAGQGTGLIISANADSGGVLFRTGGSSTTKLIVTSGGSVGIGDDSPAALFTVGSGDAFQVNSSGAIAAATGITMSGSFSQSGTGTFGTGTGTVSLNGAVTAASTLAVTTLGSADTLTYVCRNSSNQLASCSVSGTGAMFVQGGNSFGGTATIGTNDNNNVEIETNGTTRLTIDTSGNATLTGDFVVQGGDITGNGGLLISGGTAASNNLRLQSTTNSTRGSIILEDVVTQFSSNQTFTSSPIFIDIGGGASRTHTMDVLAGTFQAIGFSSTIQFSQTPNPFAMGALFAANGTFKNTPGSSVAGLGPFYTLLASNDYLADQAAIAQSIGIDVFAQTTYGVVNSFDRVTRNVSGTHTDITTEANNYGGTPYNIVNSGAQGANDGLYILDSATFTKVIVDIATAGVGATTVVEYCSNNSTGGANSACDAWTAVSGLTDGTSNLTADGNITWTDPGASWISSRENTTTGKWLRIRSSSAPSTAPTANYTAMAIISVPTTGAFQATITVGTGAYAGKRVGLSVANATGGGVIGEQQGVVVEAQTAGGSNAGILVGEATGTNNANLVLGQTTIPSGSWSIYNSSTDANYFAGSLGIGTTGADRKLDILDASNPQLRLTHTDGSVYTDLQTTSDGYLTLTATGNRIVLGTVDATATLLVLDTKNTVGDPTGVEGAMYYNSGVGAFRCYENGKWKNCIGLDADSYRANPVYSVDFFDYGNNARLAFAPWTLNNDNASQVTGTGDADHPGVVEFSTTAANGSTRVTTDLLNMENLLLGGNESFEFVFKPVTTTNTSIYAGFHDTLFFSGVDADNGVYFDIIGTTLRGNINNNNSLTSTSTTYSLSADTWYRAKLTVNGDMSGAVFTLYDDSNTQLWTSTVTAAVPGSAGREVGNGIVMTNSGGAVHMLDLDYMSMWWDRYLTR